MENNGEYEKALSLVKEDGLILMYVKPNLMTFEMCVEAIKNDGRAIKYLRKKHLFVCEIPYIVKKYWFSNVLNKVIETV